ncbi:MAG: sensor histidine kinase [Muricoprocola sp.]
MKIKQMIKNGLLNQSIQSKLNIFFGVLVLIPMLFFGMIFTVVMRNTQMKQIEKNSMQSLNESAREVEYTLAELDNIIISSLWNEELMEFLNSETMFFSSQDEKRIVKGMMQSITNTRKDVDGLILVANSGERFFHLCAESNPARFQQWIREEGKNRSEEEQERYEHSRTIWCGLNTEGGYIMGVHKIRDPETLDASGTLYIFLNEETIRKKYENLKATPGSFFMIRDEAGRIVSCDLEKTAISDEIEVSSKKNETMLEGEKYYFKTVEEESSGWSISEFSPKKEIMQNVYQMQMTVMAVFLIVSGIMIITIHCFSRTLMAPIDNLREKMIDVQNGDLNVKAEVMYKDELGELTETFNNMTMEMKRLIEEDYKSKLLIREAEYKFLRAQINPHFLYNTLDSISWMASMNGDREVSKMSVALGRILRWAISNTENLVELEEEIRNVEDYLSIQQIRYGSSLKYTIAVEDREMKQKVPKMILQPLVENALIHGLEMKSSEKKIIIVAEEKSKCLELSVIDNGIGMSPERIEEVLQGKVKQEKQHGVGVYNVHQRIQMHYGENYGIQIFSEQGKGTEVRMVFPLERGEKL